MFLFADSDLCRIIDSLKERLQTSIKKGKKTYRQTVNKIDLDVIYAKLQIITLIINVCGEQENDLMVGSTIQITFIVAALMRDRDHITEQEIDDISLEIERLSRIIQYKKIQNAGNFHYVCTNKDAVKIIENIGKLLTSPNRYNKISDNILQNELTNLNKLVASSISITAIEKQQIVQALGLQKGHWFKCSKGHYYIITECGGPNQISTCNECGEKIGGTQHRLLPGQHHAPEMDNSPYPAWSEAANLANYQLH